MASAMASGSNGLTISASVSSWAAPANFDSTSTPGSSSDWAATNSLATRFMPSRNGVTTPTRADAIEARQGRARRRPRRVAQRRPVELREAAVDAAGQPVELGAQLAVLVDLLARARADLQEVDLAAMLGMALEQATIGLEAVGQALGIVHAVDADGERAAGQAAGHALHQLVVGGALGLLREGLGVDADRIGEDARACGRSAAPIRRRPWRPACVARSRGSRGHAPRSGSRRRRRRRDRPPARGPPASPPASTAARTARGGRSRAAR